MSSLTEQQIPPAPGSLEESKELFSEAVQRRDRLLDMEAKLPPAPPLNRDTFITKRKISTAEGDGERIRLLSERESQTESILDGRVGNLWPVGYGDSLSSRDPMPCVCLCGEEINLTVKGFLNRMLDKEPVKKYFSPFDGNYKDASVCTHIVPLVKKAYPSIDRAYSAMRRAVAFQHAQGRKFDVPEKWFRRDTGIVEFALDVGVPKNKSMELYRTGKAGDFLPENYQWIDTSIGSDSVEQVKQQHRNLVARYYATKQRAKKTQMGFGFSSAQHFTRVALAALPEGADIRRYQIQWKKWRSKGFVPENLSWIKKRIAGGYTERNKSSEAGNLINFAGNFVTEQQYFQIAFRMGQLTGTLSVEEALDQVWKEFDLPARQ